MQLIVNGNKLHPKFSELVLKALDRMGTQGRALPKIPRGHILFLDSIGKLHSVPKKHLAWARRIDPGLRTIRQKIIYCSDGSHFFVSSTQPPLDDAPVNKLSPEEQDIVGTLRQLAFPSKS